MGEWTPRHRSTHDVVDLASFAGCGRPAVHHRVTEGFEPEVCDTDEALQGYGGLPWYEDKLHDLTETVLTHQELKEVELLLLEVGQDLVP